MVVYPLVVLKVFGVLVRIRCTHAQLRASPEVHTQLYGVIFLSSFLSALLVLSSSLVLLPFGSLARNLGF